MKQGTELTPEPAHLPASEDASQIPSPAAKFALRWEIVAVLFIAVFREAWPRHSVFSGKDEVRVVSLPVK